MYVCCVCHLKTRVKLWMWGEEKCPKSCLFFAASLSISNLYPGCENVSVRSRSMMFEPSLTKGELEVFSPMHTTLSAADDQATKAIDIQNTNLSGLWNVSFFLSFLSIHWIYIEFINYFAKWGNVVQFILDPPSKFCSIWIVVMWYGIIKWCNTLMYLTFCCGCLSGSFLGVGDFSVWEFSGNPVYYCSYDYFAANDCTALHLVLFSLEMPYETQLNQITFWLNLLKSLTVPEESIGLYNF